MATPRVLVLTGYGINCDEETRFAFERAGGIAEIVHINDLIEGHKRLNDYQVLAFPGGFSYGDDTGSGKALASRIRNNLWDELLRFIEENNLAIGICNGFQVMVNLGLLPALNGEYGKVQAALMHNDSARYTVRWVDLEFNDQSSWTKDVGRISLPIAHGEGRFYTDPKTLAHLKTKGLIATRYVDGEICRHQRLPANPTGTLEDIAGIIDDNGGRLFGIMPHPERAIDFTYLPHWTWLRERYKRKGKEVPAEGPGMKIFQNGVKYFK